MRSEIKGGIPCFGAEKQRIFWKLRESIEALSAYTMQFLQPQEVASSGLRNAKVQQVQNRVAKMPNSYTSLPPDGGLKHKNPKDCTRLYTPSRLCTQFVGEPKIGRKMSKFNKWTDNKQKRSVRL